jgi:thiosulfate dehydrogenase
MKRKKTITLLGTLAVFGLFIWAITACTPTAPTTAAPITTPKPQLVGDPIRGGQLYDEWWEALGVEVPAGDSPLWATQTTNKRSGADTWRCKECHGWDYKGVDGAYGSGSHKTGFVGVFASKDKPASDVLAALKGSTNPNHNFSTVMGEQDLTDLALFITTTLIDDSTLINADKTSKGTASAGKTLFGKVCIKCHGPAGNAINFEGMEEPEFLGHLAPDNPWEFVHKVRVGQPGWPMPSGIVNKWSDQDVADTLAYVQGFSTEAALSDGGQLYDNWAEALGVELPTENNPLWATQTTNKRSGADTWRCKECHGWDYKGKDGVYGSGSHMTGFPGILGSGSKSSAELLAWLNGGKNPDHDFSGVMKDYALNALVAFIQNEMTDSTVYVNADGSVNGDPAKGKTMFDGTCATCHGVDGKKINFGNDTEPEFFGTVAVDNPWEFFHKATLGQPGEPMPRGLALGWTLEQIADLLAFAQTLPTK